MPDDPHPPGPPSPDTDGESAAPSPPVPFPAAAGAESPDEADEFADIPSPSRRPRNPLVALAVIAVAAVLLVHLVPDARYAVSGGQPLALGEAAPLLHDGSALVDNRYVEVRGMPDFRNALLFEPKGDNYRRAFFRLMGTGSRLWVRAEQTSTRHDIAGPLVGRLRRFDALPYAEQVRDYYEKQVKVTRLLDLDELRRALGAGALATVHDRAGEPIEAAERGELQVVVDFPDELLVTLSRDKFAVEEDARRELQRLGAPIGPARETRDGFVYPVYVNVLPSPPIEKAPGETVSAFFERQKQQQEGSSLALAADDQRRRAELIAKFEERGFGFALRRERFATTLSALQQKGDALSFPSSPSQPPLYDLAGGTLRPRPPSERVEIPWQRIDSIQLASPIRIPGDAWVLVEGEAPGDFLFAPIMAAVLMLFAGFNVWLLIRGARRR